MKITKADIEAVVTYNPETGALTWKERTAEQMPIARLRNSWNGQNAGKKAGHYETANGHVRIKIKGRLVYARNVAYIVMMGVHPSRKLILKDGNKGNLKWSNIALKETKASIEGRRKRQLAANKAEPKPVYPGVVFDGYIGKWRSFINLSKFVMVNLGSFATDDEAIKARVDRIKSMGIAC